MDLQPKSSEMEKLTCLSLWEWFPRLVQVHFRIFPFFFARDHRQICTQRQILWRTIGDVHCPLKSRKFQKENHSWVKNLEIVLWKHTMPLDVMLSLCINPDLGTTAEVVMSCPRATNTIIMHESFSAPKDKWSWLLLNSSSSETNQWPNKLNKEWTNKYSGSSSVVTSVKAGICNITRKLEQIGQEASSWLGFSSTETQA